jgi:hypothetical protein
MVKYYALVSLDLAGVAPEQLAAFEQALAGMNWRRVDRIRTSWWGPFSAVSSPDQAHAAAVSEVRKAATLARIEEFEAVVEVGLHEPRAFGARP